MEISPISGGFGLPIRRPSQRDTDPAPISDIGDLTRTSSQTYTANREESSSGMESDSGDREEDDEGEFTEQEAEKPAVRHLNFFA